MQQHPLRRLCIVLGDQLDGDSAVFDGFDPECDAIWMAEVREESTHVWSHKARIAVFIGGMRQFARAQEDAGRRLYYRRLGQHEAANLGDALAQDIERLKPEELRMVRPGDFRVRESLREVSAKAGIELVECEDRHFLSSPEDFAAWAKGKKELRMEFFYRFLRKKLDVLMEDGEPAGGQWNFDADNRGSFDKRGPGMLTPPLRFDPDPLTRAALQAVEEHFGDHPGSLEGFDWPLTPEHAQLALDDFLRHRLPLFGTYQDAMWTDEPWLYHSRLSVAMNLKLLHPRTVIDAAIKAWKDGDAPLNAVEGFVRQILGWREYVRGLYWLRMPDYLENNALGADAPLPDFYWSGDIDMECLRQALGQTLRHGYAHHIQRLMVTGLFSLLLGVRPKEIHAWYLAIYVDAVEWVELPNVIGMSQFADGGVMASKPYVASGKYIQRMSNYCANCQFDPAKSTGDKACPFTTLYWDFLERHRERFENHPRAALQWRNLQRLSDQQRRDIGEQAEALRARFSPSA